MEDDVTVFVIDDDQQACNSVCALVSSMGIRAFGYRCCEDFLSDYHGEPGCLVTDVCLPGISGVDLLERLSQQEILLPVIVLTGYARTPLTVRAIKAGAVTVIDKPYAQDELWSAIRTALAQGASERTRHQRHCKARARMASLTSQERRILDLLVIGRSNKTIATEMGLSLRTVENRRRDLVNKLQANSVPELVRLVLEANQSAPSQTAEADPRGTALGKAQLH